MVFLRRPSPPAPLERMAEEDTTVLPTSGPPRGSGSENDGRPAEQWATPPDSPTPAQLEDADGLSLAWVPASEVPASEAARALVEALTGKVATWEAKHTSRKTERREVGMAKLRNAVGAVIGGVLQGWQGDPEGDVPKPEGSDILRRSRRSWTVRCRRRRFAGAGDAECEGGDPLHRRRLWLRLRPRGGGKGWALLANGITAGAGGGTRHHPSDGEGSLHPGHPDHPAEGGEAGGGPVVAEEGTTRPGRASAVGVGD